MDAAVREDNDSSSSRDGAAHFRTLLLTELVNRPDGMTTKEVVNLFKSDPLGAAKVKGNVQYPYSLLGRMVTKEFIEKRDGRFYLPNAAANAAAESQTAHVKTETAMPSQENMAV